MEAQPTTKKFSARRWLMPLTLLLAAVLLYLALRKVNWAEMLLTLRQANLSLLLLAMGIMTLSTLLRGLRWRVLLSAEKWVSLPIVYFAMMVGYLGNAYLPARAGEVIRSLLVGEKGGISKSFSLATALTERIVDAVILVVVSAIALSMQKVLPPEMAQALKGMAVIGGVGALVVFIAPLMSGLILRIIRGLPVLPVTLKEKLAGITESFLTGAGALQNWSRLVQFLLYSAAIWSLDTGVALTEAYAFGLTLTPSQVFILLAALGISSALPSTPGYVGVYQFVAVTVLVPFGLTEAQSLAYILGFQGVSYLVITFLGLIGLWRLRGALRF